MDKPFQINKNYSIWLKELKNKIRTVQLKAAVRVNSGMLNFYWELGADIVEKQTNAKWGEGFLSKLSLDLMCEFPGIKGFSKRNLELIRQWYLFYSQETTIKKHMKIIILVSLFIVIRRKMPINTQAMIYLS